MNIVLLSGGSGKRLWPLSNELRSKQFLKLLTGASGKESMIQRVYNQLTETGIKAEITVTTNKTQSEFIRSQLGGEINIIIEPERRDTFSAIALSVANLYFKKKKDENTPILVLPVDPYAENEYFQKLITMEEFVAQDKANLVLMGIKPTYPSQKYGYILTDGTFVEKPSVETAEKLIRQGALWNCGVFAFKLKYMLDILRKYIEFSSYQDVERQYSLLPKRSFDYEVSEKEKSIAVVEYSGVWKDLGTWNTLSEAMSEETSGLVVAGKCENTHIVNELNTPIIALGLKDMVVAASPDGILVSNKHESSFLKEYINEIDRRLMYEEHSWGAFTVLDDSSYEDGSNVSVRRFFVKSGQRTNIISLNGKKAVISVSSGTGKALIDGQVKEMKYGEALCSTGEAYIVEANDDLYYIEIMSGKGI